jgi:hypothetical protein
VLWIFNIFQNILSKWGIIRFIILMCGTHEPVGCQWYDLYSLQIWSVRRPGFGPGLFKACKQGFVKCFQDLLERYENFARWILELDTQWGKPTIWGWGVPPCHPFMVILGMVHYWLYHMTWRIDALQGRALVREHFLGPSPSLQLVAGSQILGMLQMCFWKWGIYPQYTPNLHQSMFFING